MAAIEQAISLINQGRKKEAQSILKELIRSNPQEISPWFWYVETVDSLQERIQILEVCVGQNPGNLQVIKALEMLQGQQSSVRLITSMPSISKTVRAVSESTPNEKDKFEGVFYSNEPAPTQFTEVGRSDHEQRETGSPNLLIPENEQVLAKMKQINVYHEFILPFVSGKVNHDRVHSDATGIMMDKAANLPVNCKYVVYGFPALVHPGSGIIFGYAMGMGIRYRVPKTIAKEYRAYLEKKDANLRPRKKKSTNESNSINTRPPLESNWVDGTSFTSIFLHKLYAFYSGRQSQSSVMHLNVDEDLPKESPPLESNWIDRWLFPVFVQIGVLLVIVLISDAMNGFQLVRQIIDFLQQK